MGTPRLPMPPSPRSASLTRVITILGLIFGLAFGLCSVSGISLSNGGNTRSAHLVIATAVVMGVVCLICLGVVAIFTSIRSRRS